MAENSGYWNTSETPAGHQLTGYSQVEEAWIAEVTAACHGFEGVAPGYLNALVGTVTGANTVSINTGGAIVNGLRYKNDAAKAVTIPSAVGGGNTRIDRIVLRCTWGSFKVEITRIAGTDAAAPVAPAITQISGTTYDILLYQALVNTAGAVTLTDERVMAQVGTAGVANNAVTNAILRDAGACSVMGRASNSSGDPADIVASADNQILRRAGGALGFGPLDATLVPSDLIDDTMVGDRVPQFYRRQGGSDTSWREPGGANYIPGAVRMQGGTGVSGILPTGIGSVVFPVAFSNPPLIFVSVESGMDDYATYEPPTAEGFTFRTWCDGVLVAGVQISWLAIGPE